MEELKLVLVFLILRYVSNVSFSITGEKPHHYQMVLGEDMKVVLNVGVVNSKESAYETKLFVELPEMVDFAKITSAQNEVTSSPN